jgi:hypothetical protein
MEMNDILYGRYVIGYSFTIILSNFSHSLMLSWRILKISRRDDNAITYDLLRMWITKLTQSKPT